MSLLLLAAAALSLVWTPWPAYEIDIPAKLKPPSWSHWLGTDVLGRDVASLLLVGARNSILVGVIAVGIGLLVGTALGLLASARRGWVEELIMRVSDFGFAFPAILSAIMMTAVFGPGIVPSRFSSSAPITRWMSSPGSSVRSGSIRWPGQLRRGWIRPSPVCSDQNS